MTLDEMRYEFNLGYNNIMSNMSPALDDYEISLFLTQAQEDLISQYYVGKPYFEGFENSERMRRALSILIKNKKIELTDDNNYIGQFHVYVVKLHEDEEHEDKELKALNAELFMIINERAKMWVDCRNCSGKIGDKLKEFKIVNITPAKYDELNLLLNNPFRRPNQRRVLRLDEEGNVKLLSKEQLVSYIITYLRRPQPIILSDIPAEYAIRGVSKQSKCELSANIHRDIVQGAVLLAKQSWAK